MKDTLIIRNVMDGKQIAQGLINSDIDELLEGLESGKYKLEPSFMKFPDGKLKIMEISIVPSEANSK